LKKEIDKTNPEKKEPHPAHNKSKEGSLLKFAEDAKQVEAEARRIPHHAPNM